MKSFLFLAFLFIAFSANAATSDNRVGNGGDVVICKTRNGTQYSILDQFEDVDLRHADMKGEGLSFEEEAVKLIERLKAAHPMRYQAYMDTYHWFLKSVVYTSFELEDVEDGGNPDIYFQNPYSATRCSLEQAALFSSAINKDTGRFDYFVNKKIWNHLSAKQKAVLVLHEIIYSELISLGFQNSELVREINRIILRNDVEKIALIDSFLVMPVRRTNFTYGGFKRALASSLSSDISSAIIQSTIESFRDHKFCRRKSFYKLLEDVRLRFEFSNRLEAMISSKIKSCEN